MDALKGRILREGRVRPGNILKVDSFLNHQIDVAFLQEIGEEFHRIFSGRPITKILTIESSGIAVACMTAQSFGVPVVFAKKAQTKNLDGSLYRSIVRSYTYGKIYDVVLSRRFLGPEDHVLIVDDFLANGCAAEGLIDIIGQAGASLEGVGIVIEKGFQEGGKMLREKGVNLHSLAIIESMTDNTVVFREE